MDSQKEFTVFIGQLGLKDYSEEGKEEFLRWINEELKKREYGEELIPLTDKELRIKGTELEFLTLEKISDAINIIAFSYWLLPSYIKEKLTTDYFIEKAKEWIAKHKKSPKNYFLGEKLRNKIIKKIIIKFAKIVWMNKLLILMLLTVIFSGMGAYFAGKGAYYAEEGINIQEQQIAVNEKPFFKYDYLSDKKLFKIISDDKTYITEVRWLFPTLPDEESSLAQVNWLTADLSWYELRDFYAREFVPEPQAEKAVECLFFMYAQEGIPAVVEIIYNKNNESNLKTLEFILISRLDTQYPKIKQIKNNITEEEIPDLLNTKDYNFYFLSAYNMTIETIQERGISIMENGECGIKINQPFEGY